MNLLNVLQILLQTVIGILCMVPLALAALAPRSREQLTNDALYIIVGAVKKIDHKEVRADMGTDHRYIALVQVESVEKGVWPFQPETVKVSYWQTGKRPGGWTGPQGQDSGLTPGSRVRLFCVNDRRGDLQLLEPNGWEPAA